ncbi:GGDEF domain-containing protein [Deinococcus aquaedulcis]|uniref:GGDEF domain-containing protein n=1 Tax=Deinococcus aquaedulcis TaxID=2840455 RepID=UPI001C8281F6|nr:GGDEF domain-containing protein [Deinococcus aquaedulcis]
MKTPLPLLLFPLLGLCAVYSAALVLARLTGHDTHAVDLLYMAVLLLCAGVGWQAYARASGAGRRLLGWGILSLSALAAGEAAWVLLFDLPGREAPDLSLADAGYLIYYAGLLGLLLLGQRRGRNPGALLDSVIVGLVVAQASWVLALVPLLQEQGSSLVFRVLNLSYVALDIVLLTLVLFTLRQPLAAPRWPLLLGLLAYVVADLLYFNLGPLYQPRGPLDLLWAWGAVGQAVGIVLLARAGQPQDPGPAHARLELVLRALPYVAVLASCTLLVLYGPQNTLAGRGVVLLTAAVFGVVTLRQALSNAESLRLNRQLQAQAEALRQSQAQMEYLAFHDGLTGLLNRAGFYRALRVALPGGATVLLLDLDGFKPVNDAHGHAAGDEVLRVVAGRLTACSAEDWHAARLGGDEFALLGPADQSPGTAQALAERVVAAVAEPVTVPGGAQVRVTGSVGLARMDGAGASEDTLVRQADAAMYRAKRAGGHRSAELVKVPG